MRMQEEDEYEWLNEPPTSTHEMNTIVMDYLVTEGFWEVVDSFAEETGLPRPSRNAAPHNDARHEIRASILAGNIDEAYRQINDIEPALLDDEPLLHYRLLQQKLIDLIRNNDVEEALSFAQNHLSELNELLPDMASETECTMALLIFNDAQQSPFGSLMDQSHRRQVASEVNAALLRASGHRSQSRLELLVRVIMWLQTQLDSKNVAYPKLVDVGNASIEPSKEKTARGSGAQLSQETQDIVMVHE